MGEGEGEGKGATLEAPRTARRASGGKLFIMPAPRQSPLNRFALSSGRIRANSAPTSRCVYARARPPVHSREPVATHRGLSLSVRTVGDGHEQERRAARSADP